MGTWNFDIGAIPKGQIETKTITKKDGTIVTREEILTEKVWIAHPTDQKVYLSYWVRPTKTLATGYWCGWISSHQPKAWMPFERPVHPDLMETQA